MTIEVEHVSKHFGSFAAVKDVSLKVEEGSLSALLGPSGSGKTTVLRMIAGLETPDVGRITINGNDVSNVAARKRNVGFVFQHYALFKHMRVGDNIAFPLKVRKWKRSAVRERVSELLHLLRLESLEQRFPDQISGGQRQRVALARALASRPQVLLLDEPFAALDARVRDDLREWLRSLHEQLHVTSLFVTHDQTEAMELADRIIVMNEGEVVQAGSPYEIIHEPNSPFVMRFVGGANALEGTARHGVADFHGIHVPYPAADGAAVPVTGYFRQQQVHLSASPTDSSLRVRVQRLITTGVSTKIDLAVDGSTATFVAEIADLADVGAPVEVGSVLYATPSGLRIFEGAAVPSEEPDLVDVASG